VRDAVALVVVVSVERRPIRLTCDRWTSLSASERPSLSPSDETNETTKANGKRPLSRRTTSTPPTLKRTSGSVAAMATTTPKWNLKKEKTRTKQAMCMRTNDALAVGDDAAVVLVDAVASWVNDSVKKNGPICLFVCVATRPSFSLVISNAALLLSTEYLLLLSLTLSSRGLCCVRAA
jgi:hypothetical protein